MRRSQARCLTPSCPGSSNVSGRNLIGVPIDQSRQAQISAAPLAIAAPANTLRNEGSGLVSIKKQIDDAGFGPILQN